MSPVSDPRDAKIAALLADRFDVLGHLGRGGFATVYRVQNRRLNRVEALKVLSADLEEPDFAERFRQEARMAASLDHPHIIKIFDFGQAEDICWFTMQLVDGPTLNRELKQRGVWSEVESAKLAADVLDALDYSHRRGIIHRDMKPENILIDEDRRPFVMDFGIAKSEQSVVHTRTGTILGSPAYIAPEQLTGGAVDGRADIYSLGATLYRMVSNSFPFQDSDPVRMAMKRFTMAPEPLEPKRPGIDPSFVAIVMKALEREPANRFATAGEMATMLRLFLAGKPVDLPLAPTVVLPSSALEPGGTPRGFSAPFPSAAGPARTAGAAVDSASMPTIRTPGAAFAAQSAAVPAPPPAAVSEPAPAPARRSRAPIFAAAAAVAVAAGVLAVVLRGGLNRPGAQAVPGPGSSGSAAASLPREAPTPAARPTDAVASLPAPTVAPEPLPTTAPARPVEERPRPTPRGAREHEREVRTARRDEPAPSEPVRRRPVVPALIENEVALDLPASVAREYANRSVGLAVVVGEDGSAKEVRVISPVCPECDRSARAAVLRYRFKPARDAEGRPVESKVAVPVIISAPE